LACRNAGEAVCLFFATNGKHTAVLGVAADNRTFVLSPAFQKNQCIGWLVSFFVVCAFCIPGAQSLFPQLD
jgi:hypothetical protein